MARKEKVYKRYSPEQIERMRNSPHAGWYVAKKTYPFVIGKCEICSGDIVVKDASFDKPTRRYCSRSCRAKATNKTRIWTPAAKAKVAASLKKTWVEGKIWHHKSPEYREQIRQRNLGEKSHFWKGGLTTENRKLRNSARVAEWRKHVFQRDNWTCQACGDRSRAGHAVILNADHELPWALYPDLRFEILNGRTLCLDCHKKTPTFARKLLPQSPMWLLSKP